MTSNKVVVRYGINTKGNDYIVGDIHGCYSKLESALDKIGFSESVDRLFSVGDLGDRGSESHRSIEFLNKDWFIAIRGNHEDMFMQFHDNRWPTDNFMRNGGTWAVAMTKKERLPYYDAYSDLPIVIELETEKGLIGIVHADVPENDWATFVDGLRSYNRSAGFMDSALWSRDRYNYKDISIITGIDLVVVGHTVVKEPLQLGNVLYIDTGACFERTTGQGHNGYGLSIFDVQSMSVLNTKPAREGCDA